jgi:tRNA(Ile)-lysidine synthase TilS/MesJ
MTCPERQETEKKVWIVRSKTMGDAGIRCQKCVLPSACPTLSIDPQGVCSFCRRWDNLWANMTFENQEVLNRVIEKVRDPNNVYDCLSGLSGGKDSSYAIYLCKQYGLRQMAVTFDNGFLSEEGLHNIKAIVSHFSIGHVLVNPGWENLRKLYRHSLLHTGEFCSVCNVGIRAALYRVARLFKIRSIIAGTSPRTEADTPQEFFCCSNDYFINVFKGHLSRKEINQFMYLGQYKRGLWHLTGRLRWIQLPRYVPWKEDQILSILSSKTGWKGTLWQQHTDCTMSEVKEYLNLKRNGFIEKASKLSSLIRDGQITREKALVDVEKEEAHLRDREKQIQEKMAAVFELTKEEVQQVIRLRHHAYLPKTGNLYNALKKRLYK